MSRDVTEALAALGLSRDDLEPHVLEVVEQHLAHPPVDRIKEILAQEARGEPVDLAELVAIGLPADRYRDLRNRQHEIRTMRSAGADATAYAQTSAAEIVEALTRPPEPPAEPDIAAVADSIAPHI